LAQAQTFREKVGLPQLIFCTFTLSMGHSLSRGWGRVCGRIETKILMVGMDAAGKTTMLYKLRLGKVTTTIPTIGFNVEELQYSGSKLVSFTAWDVGGRGKIRALWRYYYQNVNALVFVVDSNDHDRVEEAKDQLQEMLAEEALRDVPLLVFANKQDLPGAMSTATLCDKLGLHTLRGKLWYIQASCATTGDGLYEGLNWLTDAVLRCAKGPVSTPDTSFKEHQKRGNEFPTPVMPESNDKHDASGSASDTESTADTDILEEEDRLETVGRA